MRIWWNFRRALLRASRGDSPRIGGEKDIVVLPCWRRPEFLWHCLDNLTRADAITSVHVLFRVDTGFHVENLQVIDSFASRLSSFEVQIADPCPFRRTKPSANLLLGCLHAAAAAKELVFLVEEDIMVARDFFTWHRAVHAASDRLFCSIAVKNPNRRLVLPSDPAAYYLSSGDYCSNGVCFGKRVVQALIAPHVNMAYMRRPKKYLRRHFPESSVGLGYVEQDGLVRRIQEHSADPIAWPSVPRAFHSGFYGAGGGWQSFSGMGGSLEKRVKTIGDTIYSPDAVRSSIERPEFLESCMPSDLETAEWRALRKIDIRPQQSAEI